MPAITSPTFEYEFESGNIVKGYFIIGGDLSNAEERESKWYLINNETVLRTVENEGKTNEAKIDVDIISVSRDTFLYRYYSLDTSFVILTKK